MRTRKHPIFDIVVREDGTRRWLPNDIAGILIPLPVKKRIL